VADIQQGDTVVRAAFHTSAATDTFSDKKGFRDRAGGAEPVGTDRRTEQAGLHLLQAGRQCGGGQETEQL
jgi:hypothetical protein